MNKTIRNIFIASLISASIIGSAALASPAAAQSVSDIQKQIQELLAKVAELRAQLATQTQASATASTAVSTAMPHRICAILSRNLSQGTTGDDVSGLQEFLRDGGYFYANTTGYFGPVTAQAVAKWQSAQGISSVGAFGPMSRERLKTWCGNFGQLSARPVSGTAPLTVNFAANVTLANPQLVADAGDFKIVFGDGSEQVLPCTSATGSCQGPHAVSHTYTTDGSYTATLVHFGYFGIPNPDGSAPTQILGTVNIRVGGSIACTKEYQPVCAQKQVVCITAPCNPVQQTYGNRCMAEADGATVLYDGQCRADTQNPAADPRCKSWYDGCNTCSRQVPGAPAMCTLRACTPESTTKPYCTSYFDDTTANRAPSISSFSGPTTLSVNQSGTWSISASDPDNQALSYSVIWGDEVYANTGVAPSYAYDAFVQNTTFTHAYASAGTYTVIVVVRDSQGLEAKTTTTVRVDGGGNTACTMEYAPVCGRPTGCANTCPAGQYCMTICRLHDPVTYGNRCMLNAAGAQFLHEGVCNAQSGNIY